MMYGLVGVCVWGRGGEGLEGNRAGGGEREERCNDDGGRHGDIRRTKGAKQCAKVELERHTYISLAQQSMFY